MQKYFLALILAVVLMVSCDTTKKTATTVNDQAVIGTTWKLTSLEGQAITSNPKREREIHFVLREDGQVTGFTGCNTFSGTYKLEKGNRISFGQMLSTLMACSGLEVNESAFLQVFELADNYTIKGNVLMLNVGKRAPLAVFEAV